jgi:hypothetical protein
VTKGLVTHGGELLALERDRRALRIVFVVDVAPCRGVDHPVQLRGQRRQPGAGCVSLSREDLPGAQLIHNSNYWTVTGTAADVAVFAVGSVDVAVRVCGPLASATDGVHVHAPVSEAVAVHTAEPSDLTVTLESGSAAPATAGVLETVAADVGDVIAGCGGKAEVFATPSPLMVTLTL